VVKRTLLVTEVTTSCRFESHHGHGCLVCMFCDAFVLCVVKEEAVQWADFPSRDPTA
jgi:hypothetical protein